MVTDRLRDSQRERDKERHLCVHKSAVNQIGLNFLLLHSLHKRQMTSRKPSHKRCTQLIPLFNVIIVQKKLADQKS